MTAFTLLGDVMVDVTAAVAGPIAAGSDTPAAISLQPGGSAANTARWIAWSGRPSSLIGCIGDDTLGALAQRALSRDGVTPLLAVQPGATTGTCVVIVDPTGERTMLPDGGANALLTAAQLPAAAFAAPGHFHLSGYTLLRPATRAAGVAACRRARQAGMSVSLDASSAAPIIEHPDAFDEALGMVDLLIANADEAAALTGAASAQSAIRELADRVSTVVVKLGPSGAIGLVDGQVLAAPATAKQVRDTTGAGDAFAAGLLCTWSQGTGLEQALARGNEVAAIAVSRVGAGPPASGGEE